MPKKSAFRSVCQRLAAVSVIVLAMCSVSSASTGLPDTMIVKTFDNTWEMSDTSLTIMALPENITSLKMHFRCELTEGKSEPSSALLTYRIGGDTLLIELYRDEVGRFDLDYDPSVRCRVSHNTSSDGAKVLCDKNLGGIFKKRSGYSMRISGGDGRAFLEAGADDVDLETLCGFKPGGTVGIAMRGFSLSRYELSYDTLAYYGRIEPSALDSAINRLRASDGAPGEGVWTYQDRDMDEYRGRLGGTYELMTVRRSDGLLDIVYLDGAESGRELWEKGMVKGRLRPTGIEGQYDLEWIDAFGREVVEEAYGLLEGEGRLLRLVFPTRKISVRWRKK